MLVVGLDDLSYRGLPPSGFDGEPVFVNFFGQLKPHARWIRNASSRFHKFGGRICQPRCFLPQGTRVQRALSRSPVQVCMDCAPNRSQILKGLVPGSRIPLPTDTPRFHAGLVETHEVIETLFPKKENLKCVFSLCQFCESERTSN